MIRFRGRSSVHVAKTLKTTEDEYGVRMKSMRKQSWPSLPSSVESSTRPRGKAAGTIARCDADSRASSVLAHEHCEMSPGAGFWKENRVPTPRMAPWPAAHMHLLAHPACCVSQSGLSASGPSPRFPLDWEWEPRRSWSLVKFAMSWICAMLDFLFAL